MLAKANLAGSTLDAELADKANDLLSTHGLSATTWAKYPDVPKALELIDVLLAGQIARELGRTLFPYIKIC